MSDQFAGSIASALQSYDNFTQPRIEYDYMSWSGAMINSTTFANKLFDFRKSTIERMFAEEGRIFDPGNSNFSNIELIGNRNCN